MLRLSYVPAYLYVNCFSTYLASLIVHHQFKRNICLSLLCDWIFLCLQNHFSFLSSKYAVEACDINNSFAADLVHCLAIVQATYVICLHLCVADSVTPFPPCVFYFKSDQVCTFFPRAKYFNRQKFSAGERGGGGRGGLFITNLVGG